MKERINIIILILINVLFGIKYISRVTNYYIILSLLIAILPFCFLFVAKKYKWNIPYQINWVLLFIFTLLSVFLFDFISVYDIKVDRWSVISSFWKNFEIGEYVYFARSIEGNPPGPMPFYYILAYPFYLVGELGFFSLLGLYIFLAAIKFNKVKNNMFIFCLVFLMTSPFYLWEIVCRSNVFTNSALVLISIVYYLKSDRPDTKKIIIFGIIFGLLLSTRNIFCIAYITLGIYSLKSGMINLKKAFVLAIMTLSTFCITFIPFVWNNWDNFLIINPFVVQSTFLMPFYMTLIFVVLSFIFPFFCKTKDDIYFYVSLNLFLCIASYFIYQSIHIGILDAVFGRFIDISYFIFGIPFALYFISIKKGIRL